MPKPRIAIHKCTVMALAILAAAVGFAQEGLAGAERDSVLAGLAVLYGGSVDSKNPAFALTSSYLLTPTFPADGVLIKLTVEPKDKTHRTEPTLSRTEFESILAQLDSIKRIGALEEDPQWGFVHGGRSYQTRRFHNAYISTAKLIGTPEPRPLQSATINYVYPLTGVAKFPRGSKPEGTDNSFALVCVNGLSYMSPKLDATKIWSNGDKPQTLYVAGPTGDTPDCGE